MRLFFIVFLCFLFRIGISQNDVINTVKGDKIICNIIKEDSAKVYFKVGGTMSGVEASIERSQITSIEYAPKKGPETPKLMQAPGQIEHDDYVASTITAVPESTTHPEKQNSISVCIGMSSPVGKFNSSVLDTNSIGPAINGVMAGIGFTHLIKNNFGINITGFLSSNELNAGPIAAKYKYNTDSTWSANRVSWQAFGISLSGIYYKRFKDFSFFAKATAGYLSLKYPELHLTMHSDNYRNFQSATADAFSFGGGIGAGYKLFENLNVTVEVNYIQATFKYSEILILGEEPSTAPATKILSITKRDVKQTYQNIFISLGVNYWF